MPIGKYYKGHGEEVLRDMIARYGKKKGTSVFYATAKAKGMEPADEGSGSSGSKKDPARRVLASRR
jgi:hypothetical protein